MFILSGVETRVALGALHLPATYKLAYVPASLYKFELVHPYYKSSSYTTDTVFIPVWHFILKGCHCSTVHGETNFKIYDFTIYKYLTPIVECTQISKFQFGGLKTSTGVLNCRNISEVG